MIDREHLIKKFIEYASIDSETFHEKQLGQTVARDLENLGLEVRTDTTDENFIFNFPQSFSNIYGYLKGNKAGGPFLLSAHLDTVSPGKKKTPKVMEGRISSAGETVLGADDVSGIVSIMEAIRTLKEENLPHPDIEVLITTAEEAFCEGSKYLDYKIIKSKKGYVLDLSGPVGRAAIRAPSIISFEIDIRGKAAHAGFEPQAGINALKIASAAISDSPTGWVDETTTVNFGIISGGSGINTVPESVNIKGEVRSLDHTRAKKETEEIFKRFEETARKAGGVAFCSSNEHIEAYEVSEDSETARHFLKAAERAGLASKLVTTYGGSDANRLNEQGIETIVLSCGMENAHTKNEYIEMDELEKSAELTLSLILN